VCDRYLNGWKNCWRGWENFPAPPTTRKNRKNSKNYAKLSGNLQEFLEKKANNLLILGAMLIPKTLLSLR